MGKLIGTVVYVPGNHWAARSAAGVTIGIYRESIAPAKAAVQGLAGLAQPLVWTRADLATGVEAYRGSLVDQPAPASIYAFGANSASPPVGQVAQITTSSAAIGQSAALGSLQPLQVLYVNPSTFPKSYIWFGDKNSNKIGRIYSAVLPPQVDFIQSIGPSYVGTTQFLTYESASASVWVSGNTEATASSLAVGSYAQLDPVYGTVLAIYNGTLVGPSSNVYFPGPMVAYGGYLYIAGQFYNGSNFDACIFQVQPTTGEVVTASANIANTWVNDITVDGNGLLWATTNATPPTTFRPLGGLIQNINSSTLVVTPLTIAGYTPVAPGNVSVIGSSVYVSDVVSSAGNVSKLVKLTLLGVESASATYGANGVPGMVTFDGTNVWMALPGAQQVLEFSGTSIVTTTATVNVGFNDYGLVAFTPR